MSCDYELAREKLNAPDVPRAHLSVVIDPATKSERWTCMFYEGGEWIERTADTASAAVALAMDALKGLRFALKELAAGDLG